MIGVDWGTTSIRAYRFDGPAVRDRLERPGGILQVPPGDFPAALRDVVGPWLQDGERRVLLSGMVGSRQGWIEAPYLPCPADTRSLASALVAVPFDNATVLLVPGLTATAGEVPEVMRGEEVQILGALDQIGPDGVACLPGSHSKWARLRAGRVDGFTTHMTGEAFAALRDHTILGRLMDADAPHDRDAFGQGVARSAEPGGLLHHLFGVRTLGLFGRLPPGAAASYLSGLVIGHEVRAAAPGAVTTLIGAGPLCALYAVAIGMVGGRAVLADTDAAARGLATIGEHAAWT